MIRSPLRYPGGKSRAVKLIAKLIPDFKEYREPFIGGGSVFLYLKQTYPNRKFWINDIYNELFTFWKMCKDNLPHLTGQVLRWRNQYSEGKKLHRQMMDNITNYSDLRKAAAFFIINRITFSGTTESGGYSDESFRLRFTESSIERLKMLDGVLNKAKITNLDYEKVVKANGEKVFIFLDPPYQTTTSSALYGRNGRFHKTFDHKRFAQVMRNCKHKWLITYNDSEYIRDLFSFAHIKTWDITYGMRNVTKKSDQLEQELFIANYPITLQAEQQLSLFEKRANYKTK